MHTCLSENAVKADDDISPLGIRSISCINTEIERDLLKKIDHWMSNSICDMGLVEKWRIYSVSAIQQRHFWWEIYIAYSQDPLGNTNSDI